MKAPSDLWCRFIPLATLLCLGTLQAKRSCAQGIVIEDEVVTFNVLDLGKPVTSHDVSEDGQFLAISHQGDDAVTIFDLAQKKAVATIKTASPRSVLWRNGSIIVANQLEGVISVFDQRRDWKQTSEIILPKPGIKHLSAPRGRNFRQELIATCHGDG
ncbi:MAG: hypothetical protein AAFX06_31455, partial [Planctomycetota bacterium]